MTNRERYLVVMLANGLRTKEIAGQTKYKPETVDLKFMKMFKKYGVKNRPQLVALGFKMKELI